jgi:hypothetical protein
MFHTRVVIIGAGQAGLSVSKQLTDVGVDHVVLERGRTAERWTSQRWDSLRLLTPNWMSRLPSWSYRGTDPSGFMPAAEVSEYLTAYADSFGAPIIHGAEVISVRRRGAGYQVVSDAGIWSTTAVVIATGYSDQPAVPQLAGTFIRRFDKSPPICIATLGTSPTVASSSSGPPRPARSSLTNWQPPEGMSSWQSAGTLGSHVVTGEWTSCGGWTRWACSTGS